MTTERYDRNVRFFGKNGQDRLAAAHVAVVGIGGLGTHVVQQLAFLGVGKLTLIDPEELDDSNRNRYVGARYNDPLPSTKKVAIGRRLIEETNPEIQIIPLPISVLTREAFDAIIQSDNVFGCIDKEGLRLVLIELCAAYEKTYFDLATEIIPGEQLDYGGRVCIAWDGNGCLICHQELDTAEGQDDLLDPAGRSDRDAMYGVRRELLRGPGPSVISLNGVVASLGVTEYMVAVTGLRRPYRLLRYNAKSGMVTKGSDPYSDCYYCRGIRGKGQAADLTRYLPATDSCGG